MLERQASRRLVPLMAIDAGALNQWQDDLLKLFLSFLRVDGQHEGAHPTHGNKKEDGNASRSRDHRCNH
jgi:hypothetical protein